MANLKAAMPIEENKSGAYLHDRTRIPANREWNWKQWAANNQGYLWGIAFGLLLTAAVMETREAWESHRDWVPPALLVPAVLGGLALGHLGQRGKVNVVAVPGFLLGVTLFAVVMHLWVKEDHPGNGGLLTTFTIISYASLIAAAHWLIAAVIFVEATDPTRPPEPEM